MKNNSISIFFCHRWKKMKRGIFLIVHKFIQNLYIYHGVTVFSSVMVYAVLWCVPGMMCAVGIKMEAHVKLSKQNTKIPRKSCNEGITETSKLSKKSLLSFNFYLSILSLSSQYSLLIEHWIFFLSNSQRTRELVRYKEFEKGGENSSHIDRRESWAIWNRCLRWRVEEIKLEWKQQVYSYCEKVCFI